METYLNGNGITLVAYRPLEEIGGFVGGTTDAVDARRFVGLAVASPEYFDYGSMRVFTAVRVLAEGFLQHELIDNLRHGDYKKQECFGLSITIGCCTGR